MNILQESGKFYKGSTLPKGLASIDMFLNIYSLPHNPFVMSAMVLFKSVAQLQPLLPSESLKYCLICFMRGNQCL